MAGDAQEQDVTWPRPKFRYLVDIADVGTNLPFQEVSGLDVDTQSIEFRGSNNPIFSPSKVPGLKKARSVTLMKGSLANDNAFFDWHTKIGPNAIKRSTVTIKLIDEKGALVMTFTLTNALFTKVTGVEFDSDRNEVAVERIEIVCDEPVIETG